MVRRASFLVVLSLCLPALPARAWDPELHVAVFEAARQISPVLDSRFDPAYTEDVLAGLRDADPSDALCQRHRGVAGHAEAWDSAESTLASLRTPHPSWTPRQRARAFGVYLHYVADCTAPAAAIKDRLRTVPFDLAVYREKRPLTEPLAAALKARSAGTLATESGYEAVTPAFRAAANLTIEAALLVPPRGDVREPEDVGPVLLAPVLIIEEKVGGRRVETARILHAGLHVLEWIARSTPGASVVRALVQNNLEFCVRHVFFRVGDWVGGVSASIPSQSLAYLEFPGPASSPEDVIPRFVPGECPVEPGHEPISLAWMRLVPTERMKLRFDAVREFKPGAPRPEPIGKALFVEYLESDMPAMKGLDLPEFQARAENDRVEFRYRVRNRDEKKPKPFVIDFEVFSTKGRMAEVIELKVDLAGLPPGAERSFQGTIPVKTYGATTALRIRGIRRADAPVAEKSRQVRW